MISICTTPGEGYGVLNERFDPGERYPEYRFDGVASRPNPAYAGVRTLFRQAGLDAGAFGTAAWNPLGAWIRPGASVFVLCNFVYHRRPQESKEDFFAKCIHGAVLRALVDYVLIATGPSGRVAFGNAPLQSCRWDRVLAETGAARVLQFYEEQAQPVVARDLRLVVSERDLLGRVVRAEQREEHKDAVEVNFAEDSLLAELADPTSVHPRFRVADYDPRRTEAFHQGRSHRYVLHRAVLDADVVVSLSKLKTHEKVGMTCGLKGFVGAVAHKDCLAHHRYGSPDRGGDEFPPSHKLLEPVSRFQDWLNRRNPDAPFHGALQIADRSLRRVLRRAGATLGGAWHGNDTCWRMALDLARLLHHADASGALHDRLVRTHLSLIDGIVAGEGDGPLDPDPVHARKLVFGDDVALVDRFACRLMGLSPHQIPLVARAFGSLRYPISAAGEAPAVAVVDGEQRPESELRPAAGRPFRAPSGWRSRLERAA